mmetsp:Transcript_1170/g.1685  ORF Transcript_1170/g.1685 Transcript_1170/m.1685 type:complete len:345 (-) Transcript_1170:133-1167(-)
MIGTRNGKGVTQALSTTTTLLISRAATTIHKDTRTMRRPNLIFACLLRSSAALALDSSSRKVAPSISGSSSSNLGAAHHTGRINLRVARRTDVPYISSVNVATLPENYNHQFYLNHLHNWPDLAIVAEHVQDDDEDGKASLRFKSPFGGHDPNKQSKIVAYVLGKVDAVSGGPNGDQGDDYKAGHVTSLAVDGDYRRHRIASELMKQLHYHMATYYRASHVSLHVRMSNRAATRLYCENMGYEVADIIRGYYQDGEDAFLMKKYIAEECDNNVKEQGGLVRRATNTVFPFGNTASGLSNGIHRLPRMIVDLNEKAAREVAAQAEVTQREHLHGQDQVAVSGGYQ